MGRKKGTIKPIAVAGDPLDALAIDPQRVIAMLLWKFRHHNPGMSVLVTADDMQAYTDCMDYLKQSGVKDVEVRTQRDQGRPEHEGREGTKIAAIKPRPFVTVALVERGTWNAIKPVENNEKDHAYAEQLRNARLHAQTIANNLLGDLQAGNTSTDTIKQAAQYLRILSQ